VNPAVPAVVAIPALPPAIDALVDELAAMRGVVAVVLGGSRAVNGGVIDARSDWDLGVYYRGAVELDALAARGELHRPGAWGRLMNGGAWLIVDGVEVDVMLRDLDVVDHWCARAEDGVYELDALLGYAAGAPTYLLRAERTIARTLRGAIEPIGPFPEALAAAATPRWRFAAQFSLEQARMRAARADVVGAVAQASKAVIEEAHARLCERREWVLNEKRIVERAGLGEAHATFARGPRDQLDAWVDEVARAIAVDVDG